MKLSQPTNNYSTTISRITGNKNEESTNQIKIKPAEEGEMWQEADRVLTPTNITVAHAYYEYILQTRATIVNSLSTGRGCIKQQEEYTVFAMERLSSSGPCTCGNGAFVELGRSHKEAD